jgi:hypothetical protein
MVHCTGSTRAKKCSGFRSGACGLHVIMARVRGRVNVQCLPHPLLGGEGEWVVLASGISVDEASAELGCVVAGSCAAGDSQRIPGDPKGPCASFSLG